MGCAVRADFSHMREKPSGWRIICLFESYSAARGAAFYLPGETYRACDKEHLDENE